MTFSTVYPSYHPRKGEPTYFVEKIWDSIGIDFRYQLKSEVLNFQRRDESTIWPKHHTIRAGHRWRAGDWFSPRVWGNDINPKTGRKGPYHSKQITFAPNIQIKKVWYFELTQIGFIKDCLVTIDGVVPKQKLIPYIANNDGLTLTDFNDWFTLSPDFRRKKTFSGQIICWNENINY